MAVNGKVTRPVAIVAVAIALLTCSHYLAFRWTLITARNPVGRTTRSQSYPYRTSTQSGVASSDDHAKLERNSAKLERNSAKLERNSAKLERNKRMLEPVHSSPPTSSKELVRLKVLVKSAPKNGERRKQARNNWAYRCKLGDLHNRRTQSGSRSRQSFDYNKHLSLRDEYYNEPGEVVFEDAGHRLEVACMFVMGEGATQAEKRSLQQEFQTHGDLQIGKFTDEYGIMTSKTIWTLNWSLESLDYDYVMLIDDDATVIWNHFAPLVVSASRRNLYSGHLHIPLGVRRCQHDPQGRGNCVSMQQYGKADYPPFASGFAYYMSRDVARVVVHAAILRISPYGLPGNVEDAMVGVMAKIGGVSLTASPQFLHYGYDTAKQYLCRTDPPAAVVGNAPQALLNRISDLGKRGAPLCQALPQS